MQRRVQSPSSRQKPHERRQADGEIERSLRNGRRSRVGRRFADVGPRRVRRGGGGQNANEARLAATIPRVRRAYMAREVSRARLAPARESKIPQFSARSVETRL